jgi:hypothetical protein
MQSLLIIFRWKLTSSKAIQRATEHLNEFWCGHSWWFLTTIWTILASNLASFNCFDAKICFWILWLLVIEVMGCWFSITQSWQIQFSHGSCGSEMHCEVLYSIPLVGPIVFHCFTPADLGIEILHSTSLCIMPKIVRARETHGQIVHTKPTNRSARYIVAML